MHPLLIGTTDGLIISERDGRSWVKTLPGRHVTCVIAREGVILAGTTDGIFRSDDLGGAWVEASRGLRDRRVDWLAYHPDISDLELTGTGAGIFVSRDGARSWRPLAELTGAELDWKGPLESGTVTAVAVMQP